MGQECNLGVTFTFSGVWESVKEWPHTLPIGFPLWELESREFSSFQKTILRGQNLLDWEIFYTIGNFLRHKCLNWARMIHLNTYNTSYGRKKGRKSKCQFDSQPLKVRNRLELCVFWWHVTYCWRNLDEGYNFSSNFTSTGGLHKKIIGIQSGGSLNFDNFGTPDLGVLGKMTFGSNSCA